MGKKKRSGAPLSHEEIWDDSALVQSWDDAVEEYEVYTSIFNFHVIVFNFGIGLSQHPCARRGCRAGAEPGRGRRRRRGGRRADGHWDHGQGEWQDSSIRGAGQSVMKQTRKWMQKANSYSQPPAAAPAPAPAVPSALLGQGEFHFLLSVGLLLTGCSARPSTEKPHDVVVLCRLLYRALRRTTAGIITKCDD